MVCFSCSDLKILDYFEIEAMHPWQISSISFGVFTFMLFKIGILIDKVPESICLLGSRKSVFVDK